MYAWAKPTARRPSHRPIYNEDLRLALTLGDHLGSGHCGLVYAVDNVTVSGSPVTLPPLVAKIARPHRAMEVVREAWVYDETQCLQGVAVPRCFGLFTLQLASGQICPLWKEHDDDSEDDSQVESCPAEYDDCWPLTKVRPYMHPLLLKFAEARNELVILLLERMEPMDPEDVP